MRRWCLERQSVWARDMPGNLTELWKPEASNAHADHRDYQDQAVHPGGAVPIARSVDASYSCQMTTSLAAEADHTFASRPNYLAQSATGLILAHIIHFCLRGTAEWDRSDQAWHSAFSPVSVSFRARSVVATI